MDASTLRREAVDEEAQRRERDVVAAIERGLEDMRAGRVIDHEDAMDRIDSTIERVASRTR